MSIRFSELHCKEVILVNSGQRLGFVSDALVEVPEGNITAILVPGPCRFLGLGAGRRIISSPGAKYAALARILSWWMRTRKNAASPEWASRKAASGREPGCFR